MAELSEGTLVTLTGAENAHSHNLSSFGPVQPADRHPVAVYLASLSKGSRRSTAQALRVVAQILGVEFEAMPWASLRYQHTAAVRSAIAGRLAPATCARILAALKGVLRECNRLGLMSAEDALRASDLPPVRGSRPAPGRALELDEHAALRAACELTGALGARDRALLALLYAGGLRRSEAVGLDVEQVETDQLTVHGKGNKVRLVYLAGVHLADLEAWLGLRGRDPGPLLCRVLRGGRIMLRRLTAQAVFAALRRLGQRAGVARFSPHDLRRTTISTLLDRGVDIATVKEFAGHSQLSTTQRYDRRGEKAKRAAAAVLGR